jgi:hypothetical protein
LEHVPPGIFALIEVERVPLDHGPQSTRHSSKLAVAVARLPAIPARDSVESKIFHQMVNEYILPKKEGVSACASTT